MFHSLCSSFEHDIDYECHAKDHLGQFQWKILMKIVHMVALLTSRSLLDVPTIQTSLK